MTLKAHGMVESEGQKNQKGSVLTSDTGSFFIAEED
jgi:hypothetical protein